MNAGLPLPKYHQIYLVLREQLAEGRFAQGLPGEIHLTKEFGVARVTVRRALELLAAEGLIQRTAGRGTVPLAALSESRSTADTHAPRRAAPLSGLLRNIVDGVERTTVKVLRCEVVTASSEVATQLDIAVGAPVQKAVRVRATRDGTVSHITTHIPQAIAHGFGRRDLAKKPILVLLEESGVDIGRATQSISARLADATVAQALGVAVGSALLAVTRRVFDTDDRPVQWLQGLYRPDRYQYDMQLSRVGSIDAKVWVSQAHTV